VLITALIRVDALMVDVLVRKDGKEKTVPYKVLKACVDCNHLIPSCVQITVNARKVNAIVIPALLAYFVIKSSKTVSEIVLEILKVFAETINACAELVGKDPIATPNLCAKTIAATKEPAIKVNVFAKKGSWEMTAAK